MAGVGWGGGGYICLRVSLDDGAHQSNNQDIEAVQYVYLAKM